MPKFLTVKKVADGGRNVVLQIKGCFMLDEGGLPLFGLKDFEPVHGEPLKGFKINSMVWLIEDKMSLRLWWGDGIFIAPLESRGSARFDHPLTSPAEGDDWDGYVYLDALNVMRGNELPPRYFTLIIDMDKV